MVMAVAVPLVVHGDGDHVPIYDATIPFTETALRFLDAVES